MRKHHTGSRDYEGLAMSILAGLIVLSCQAQSADFSASEASEGQWISLIQGDVTENWRGYNRDQLQEGWYMDGDILIFDSDIGSGDIITKEKYRDFELELDYNISEGGNSGIFHHVIEQTVPMSRSGPEFQLLDQNADPDNPVAHRPASLYDMIAADPENFTAAGEWNSARIISEGAHVEYWHNGEKVVEFERWTPEWYEMARNSKFEDQPSYGTVPNGHIGLQDHGGLVKFRNVRIRTLN